MSNPGSPQFISHRFRRTAGILAWSRWLLVFLTIFGAKLWVIRQYSCSVPQWDEWSGEAWVLYKPFLEGKLSFWNLFAPHNEHRIFFSRLFFLALLRLNGLWEPQLQLVLQAALHSAVIVFFISLCSRSLRRTQRIGLILATAVFFLLPFGWQNTISGFQSQFYFLMGFGTLAIWLCWRFETFSAGWWLCPIACICSLFSLGSGLFVPMACGIILAARLWCNPSTWLRQGIALVLLAAIAIWGILLVPVEMRHNHLQAASLGQLIDAILTVLSWPFDHAWALLILHAPFVLLGVWLLRRRVRVTDAAWLPLTLGLWGWAQAMATAYGRASLTLLAPRYLDTFCLTLCASFACLLIWMSRYIPLAQQKWRAAWVGLWAIAAVFGGLKHFVQHTSGDLMAARDLALAREATVKDYLASKDGSLLTTRPIPFPEAAPLKEWLDDPVIVDILPARIRPPLHSSRQISEDSFSTRSYFDIGGKPPPDGLRYWSSYSPQGAAQRGQMELKFAASKQSRWLEIFVCGQPGSSGMSLVLTDRSGRTHNLAPFFNPGLDWKPVLVKVPPGAFSILAKDDRSDAWLALSNPREVGFLSAMVERFSDLYLEYLMPLLMAGFAGLVALMVLSLPHDLRNRRFFRFLVLMVGGFPSAMGRGTLPEV